jgi:probable rRNA maturation factor
MIFLEIDPGHVLPVPEAVLEEAAQAALRQQFAPQADLTVVLTGDERIRGLNRDFLGQDRSTDVLSFPAGEADPETGRQYLGDVVISLPTAGEGARRGGHALQAELQLLVVHGVLHLLGHDHADADEKQRMWTAQAQILTALGISPSIVHE